MQEIKILNITVFQCYLFTYVFQTQNYIFSVFIITFFVMAGLFLQEVLEMDIVENDLASIDELFFVNQPDHNFNGEDFSFENINFFELGLRDLVLVLNYPDRLYLKGSLLVECIMGSVDIHGYTLGPDNLGPCLVVSGYGQSAFCLSSKDVMTSTETLRTVFAKRNILGILEKVNLAIGSSSSVLILSKHEAPPILNLLSVDKHAMLTGSKTAGGYSYFRKYEEWLNCVFDIHSGSHIPQKMTYNGYLIRLADDILKLESPRVIFCGGKGVGKSTSLQFLVNRMFDKWKAILVIDFDIGQPEFTIPGCISIVLINHPLLGPNFTHLCKPVRSISLGSVNPDMCLTKYFVAVEEFSKFCKDIENFVCIPWFINTMGYIKGFGLPFIAEIISSFHPTHVVQINSITESNLNVFPLTMENISKIKKKHFQDHKFVCNYELITFLAQNLKNTVFIPPKVSREIRVLSYMTATKLFIKQVSIRHKSQKEIGSFKSNKIISVCTPWSGSDCMECIGFGLILQRKCDMVEFLTPLSQEDLKSDFDVFVVELGLLDVSWEKLNLLKKQWSEKNIVKLGSKSKFSSYFLF